MRTTQELLIITVINCIKQKYYSAATMNIYSANAQWTFWALQDLLSGWLRLRWVKDEWQNDGCSFQVIILSKLRSLNFCILILRRV